MPIHLNLNLGRLIGRLNGAVLTGIPEGLDAAADLMRNNILRAFAVGGPGWRPLSLDTIRKKIKSGAPDPHAILREFNVMRDSIEIKNESTATFSPPVGTDIHPTVDVNHIRSVGLFSDTARKYDPKLEIGFRGPLDVVKRGMKHEFGGFETQYMKEGTPGVEEIKTKGLEKKALRGEGEVTESNLSRVGVKEKKAKGTKATLSFGISKKTGKSIIKKTVVADIRAVLKKIKKAKEKRKSQIVYIPERSFLRMPFDVSEGSLLRLIVESLRRRIDAAW